MKKLISTKMKVFMTILIVASITCFTSAIVTLYNSNFKLSDYTNWNGWNNWYLGFDSNYYDSSHYTENIFDMSLSNIQNLNFDFSNTGSDFNFEVYPGSNLIINSYTNLDNNLNVVNSEGTLNISPSTNTKSVLVKLPLSYINNLNLKLNNGNVNLSDITLASLKIENINSHITIANVKCPSTNVATTNGDINLNNLFSTDLTATSSNGDINSNNLEGNIALKTTSGDIFTSFTNKTTKVNIDSANGDVNLQLSQDTNCTIDFNTISGDIDYNSEISRKLTTSTNPNNKNSKIVIGTGNLPIFVTTISGDLNL